MKLNLTSPVQIPSIPSSFKSNSSTVDPNMYIDFSYTLPKEFISVGPVFLRSVSGYYDTVNLDGIKFCFSNGQSEITTQLFGNYTDPKQPTIPKTFYLESPVASVDFLLINT